MSAGKTVVIGCGNLLRGDDAVGPCLIRHLWERGVPHGVVLVDGGTAGMDVAFKMRGANQVILIDASATGAEPGTIYRVPGSRSKTATSDRLAQPSVPLGPRLGLRPLALDGRLPAEITVFLIEAADRTPGPS